MDEQTTGSGSQVGKPRTYTDEYRRQVVDMVTSTGWTAMSVAAELGTQEHAVQDGRLALVAKAGTLPFRRQHVDKDLLGFDCITPLLGRLYQSG